MISRARIERKTIPARPPAKCLAGICSESLFAIKSFSCIGIVLTEKKDLDSMIRGAVRPIRDAGTAPDELSMIQPLMYNAIRKMRYKIAGNSRSKRTRLPNMRTRNTLASFSLP